MSFLDDREARLVKAVYRLAAALGGRDTPLIETRMAEAAASGDATAVDELLLMTLFVTGFPAGLEAARVWSRVRTEPPLGGPEEGVDFSARGRATCAAVYGDQYEALTDGLAALHPDLPELVVSVGYGRMMSRPALSIVSRELCMIAMLVPLGAETQLYSHLRGALLVGATPEAIDEVVDVGLSAAGTPEGDEWPHVVRRLWQGVRDRGATREGSQGKLEG